MDERVPVRQAVDHGVAELTPDPARPAGWRLLVGGVPQSHVDLAEPTYLEFEYMRRLASVVDAAAPPGDPLHVLHLGAGALTLPRYIEATRPGSTQRVVDHDAALVDLVLRTLPLPDGARVEIAVADARASVESPTGARFDLVVGDVYNAAQLPRSVSTVQFAARVAALLRPLGCYAVNVADLPPLAFSRQQVATLRAVFTDVCLIAEPGLLRGRRYGNVVLAATTHRAGLPITRLTRAATRDPFPNRLLYGADLDRFVAGADPVTDDSAADSPVPPAGRLL